MIKASIDIGSNSVLLLACEFSDKIEKEIYNLSHITSLGKGLDINKVFCQESMDSTFFALKEYKEKLELMNFDISKTIVTATEAARVASNSKEFFQKVKDELGFKVTIISGEDEAYFTALGVVSGLKDMNNCTVMDIGGASTEFIKLNVKPFNVSKSISLPVGSVRGTDWKGANTFTEKMEEILKFDSSTYETDTLVCVAGSMTSLASMYLGKKVFNDFEIDGLEIKIAEFKKFVFALQETTVNELLFNFPFLGKRAQMVSAGAMVALMFCEKLNVKTIKISTRGLRYGVLFGERKWN